MNNINDMKEKLEKLEQLLKSHDWYYAMSDDHNYYKSGRRSFEAIWKLMEEAKSEGYFTEAENLYDNYKK